MLSKHTGPVTGVWFSPISWRTKTHPEEVPQSWDSSPFLQLGSSSSQCASPALAVPASGSLSAVPWFSSQSEEAPRRSQGNYWLQARARREVILKGEWRHCRCLWRLCSHYVWGVSSISLLGWITCIIHGKFQLLSWLAPWPSSSNCSCSGFLHCFFCPQLQAEGQSPPPLHGDGNVQLMWKQVHKLDSQKTPPPQAHTCNTGTEPQLCKAKGACPVVRAAGHSVACKEQSPRAAACHRAKENSCVCPISSALVALISHLVCKHSTAPCCSTRCCDARCGLKQQVCKGTNKEKPGNSWLANLAFPSPFHELTNQTTHA